MPARKSISATPTAAPRVDLSPRWPLSITSAGFGLRKSEANRIAAMAASAAKTPCPSPSAIIKRAPVRRHVTRKASPEISSPGYGMLIAPTSIPCGFPDPSPAGARDSACAISTVPFSGIE